MPFNIIICASMKPITLKMMYQKLIWLWGNYFTLFQTEQCEMPQGMKWYEEKRRKERKGYFYDVYIGIDA